MGGQHQVREGSLMKLRLSNSNDTHFIFGAVAAGSSLYALSNAIILS